MPGVLVIGFLLSLTDNLLLFNGGRCFFCDNLSPRIVNILEILRLRVLSSFSMRIYSRASEQACRLASRRVFPPAARFETSWETRQSVFQRSRHFICFHWLLNVFSFLLIGLVITLVRHSSKSALYIKQI